MGNKELDSMILVGPYSILWFCDSVIPFVSKEGQAYHKHRVGNV